MRRLILFTALALVAGALSGAPPDDLVSSPVKSPVMTPVTSPASPFWNEEAAAFSPSDVSGLLVWAEADGTMTESGGSVSSWGEPGYTALTQGTGAKQPTYTADDGDGLAAVDFDGTDDTMSTASITLSSTFEMFLVVRGSTNGRMVYEFSSDTDPNSGFTFFRVGGEVGITAQIFDGSLTSTKKGVQLTLSDTWVDFRHTYDAVSTSQQAVYEDDSEIVPTFDTNEAPDLDGVSDSLYLASRNNSSLFWNGAFRAVLLYSPAPTTLERTQILNYMRNKWNTGP